jgi:hypothetical protein
MALRYAAIGPIRAARALGPERLRREWSSVSGMPTPALPRALQLGGALLLQAVHALAAAPTWQGPLDALPQLDAASLATVVQQVVPKPDELAWRAIPWRATLRAGLLDATAERKPVLLWAMNGHPLGTT